MTCKEIVETKATIYRKKCAKLLVLHMLFFFFFAISSSESVSFQQHSNVAHNNFATFWYEHWEEKLADGQLIKYTVTFNNAFFFFFALFLFFFTNKGGCFAYF